MQSLSQCGLKRGLTRVWLPRRREAAALDETVANLDGRISEAADPYAELIALLCTIPGVGRYIAEVLIAECGVDMTVFPNAEHLVSWAGICPGTN